jgi:hypothetical protein
MQAESSKLKAVKEIFLTYTFSFELSAKIATDSTSDR